MTANYHVTERKAIEQVITRLTEAFTPAMPERQIYETVRRIHHGFDGSRIRDFVPLLVENAARKELRTSARGTETPTALRQRTVHTH